MKVTCPQCLEEIPAEHVNVQAGVAYCPVCEEGHSLQELLAPGTDEPERTEEPPGSKVAFTRLGDEQVAVMLPRIGFRGVGCFMVLFTVFWNAVTWSFVIGGAMSDEAWFVRLFMVPFVLVGLVTALVALWLIFGRTSLAMDRGTLLFRRELFGIRRQKRHKLTDIARIGLAVAYSQNEVPVYGVGIHVKNRSSPLVFGSGLSDDEKKWLVGELHAFWKDATRGDS
ncbi:MAG: hypothetical protein ACYTFI_13530 [Planctomycetota bacterium]